MARSSRIGSSKMVRTPKLPSKQKKRFKLKSLRPKDVQNSIRRMLGLNKPPRIAELVVWRILGEALVPAVAAIVWTSLFKYQPTMTRVDVFLAGATTFGFAWFFCGQYL